MDQRQSRSSLSRTLQIDAVAVAVAGVLLLIAAGPLGTTFNLDATVLRVIGIALLPWAWWVARVCQRPTERSVRIVIGGNVLWVIASLVVLVVRAIEPNGAGIAMVLLQAVLVATLALWQILSLRTDPGWTERSFPAVKPNATQRASERTPR